MTYIHDKIQNKKAENDFIKLVFSLLLVEVSGLPRPNTTESVAGTEHWSGLLFLKNKI